MGGDVFPESGSVAEKIRLFESKSKSKKVLSMQIELSRNSSCCLPEKESLKDEQIEEKVAKEEQIEISVSESFEDDIENPGSLVSEAKSEEKPTLKEDKAIHHSHEDLETTAQVMDQIESPKPEVENIDSYDRYGFVKEVSSVKESYGERNEKAVSVPRGRQTVKRLLETREQAEARIIMETSLITKWKKNIEKLSKMKKRKLRKRVREGVPDCFRSKVWPHLIFDGNVPDASEMEKQFSAATSKGSSLTSSGDENFRKAVDCIGRDLNRTLPDHFLFRECDGAGQRSLKNVLIALAASDTEVGYCQGMGFIAAVLLSYFPEASSFCLFSAIMNNEPFALRTLYSDGMPQVQLRLYQLKVLFKRYVPKLSKHFEELGINENMFATHWIVTLFSYNFPFEIVLRIWDRFFFKGWKVIFQVAVAILQQEEQFLLNCDFEGILQHLRGLPVTLDCERLLSHALQVRMKTSQLKTLESKYKKSEGSS